MDVVWAALGRRLARSSLAAPSTARTQRPATTRHLAVVLMALLLLTDRSMLAVLTSDSLRVCILLTYTLFNIFTIR